MEGSGGARAHANELVKLGANWVAVDKPVKMQVKLQALLQVPIMLPGQADQKGASQ